MYVKYTALSEMFCKFRCSDDNVASHRFLEPKRLATTYYSIENSAQAPQ